MNFRRMKECSEIIRWLDPQPGERILDIGCGDGYYSAIIAGKGAQVVGFDFSKDAIERAQALYQGHNVKFLHMNAEEMNFPNESFDKAVSFCVIEHFHNDERVIQHLARILKPHGRFVFSADSLSHPKITDQERESHRKRYQVNNFYTYPLVMDKLQRSGFKLDTFIYNLSSPLSLALVRFSWKLDDLPKKYSLLRSCAYLFLGTLGKIASDISERWARSKEFGLTLLISARKI
jgi:SAM-dependent methyltransferase